MKFPLLLLAALVLVGCHVDPATLFQRHGESSTTLTPESAPRYERVGPLPDTMEGVQAALKTSGTGCFAASEGEAASSDSGTVYLAAQEPLDVVSIDPSGAMVTANRKSLNMTVIVPRSKVEIGRFAYAKPQ